MTSNLSGPRGERTRPQPATDVDFTRFEIREGSRRITCTVSDEALEAVSGLLAPSTPLQRRDSFNRFRTLINEAARIKAVAMPEAALGEAMILGPTDLRRVPPEVGTPRFGVALRQKTPPSPE